MNDAAYHAILRRLGVEPAAPPPTGLVFSVWTPLAARVTAFRRQLEAWTATGAPGVPVLALPGVEPRAGTCVGCGEPLAPDQAWRCVTCVEAVRVALGLPADPA